MGRKQAKSTPNLKAWRTNNAGLRYQQKRTAVKAPKAVETKEVK